MKTRSTQGHQGLARLFIPRIGWSAAAFASALLWLSGAAMGQDKTSIKDHPFFKQLLGEWTSEGERKYTDGRVVKIKQEWKTEVLGADSLSSEGTRDRDGQTNSYKWTFTLMDSGLIEAVYQQDITKPTTQRYEVQLAPDDTGVEMTALLDNSAKVTITDAFKEGDHDTIESKTTRTDASGATVYTGTAVAKRKKG